VSDAGSSPVAPLGNRYDEWLNERFRKVLPSGITLVLLPQLHLHTSSISVFVGAGSRHESASDNGLSHFLEHMMFRGTERLRSPFEVNFAIERLGGTLNAATSPCCTDYELIVPPESLEEGARILGEILTRPIFADLEVERRVVQEEIREGLDERGACIDADALSRARLWPDHPLGRPITGSLENAERFGLEDLRRLYSDRYVGANTVVCVGGAFDRDRMERVLEDALSEMAGSGSRPVFAPPRPGPGPTTLHAHRTGSQTTVRLGFHAPGSLDPAFPASELLLGVLDDGMSTRLHRRIFEELGLAYSVWADLESYPDAGALSVEATCAHENVPSVVEEILSIAADLRDRAPDPAEVGKAKQRAVWSLAELLDRPCEIGGWFGERELLGRPEQPEDWARAIAAVDGEEVARAARGALCPEGLHVTTVGILTAKQRDGVEEAVRGFGS